MGRTLQECFNEMKCLDKEMTVLKVMNDGLAIAVDNRITKIDKSSDGRMMVTKPCGHTENEFCGLDCYGIGPIEWVHIGEWISEDGLDDAAQYIHWDKGSENVTIDGSLTIDEIIELTDYLQLQKQRLGGMMAYLIDGYMSQQVYIDGKWRISRPLSGSFIQRLKDAWLIITGKADAVRFYSQ